ncbi:MAG: DNA replication and repair protein RecF, partial [Patescibacteria group bacterium]
SKNKKARELAKYGSRGEQRMGVLWLKLAELAYIKGETEEKPTLLLDDIFSELDQAHRKIVMKAVEDQQTVITTADPGFVKSLKKVEKIILNG